MRDRSRSIDIEHLIPLLQIPGITFYSLQVDEPGKSAARRTGSGLIDASEFIADYGTQGLRMARGANFRLLEWTLPEQR